MATFWGRYRDSIIESGNPILHRTEWLTKVKDMHHASPVSYLKELRDCIQVVNALSRLNGIDSPKISRDPDQKFALMFLTRHVPTLQGQSGD